MLAKTLFSAAAALSLAACATYGEETVTYDNTITETVVMSPNHETLERLVVSAGLADTLSGTGPFTVFAPTDAAFAKLPPAMLEAATQPSNRPLLTKVLTYHVVPGRITAADLMQRIRAGGGKVMINTVAGEQLTFSMMGDRVMLTGKNNSMAHVTQADLMQSNGIVHVVDGVVTPTM